MAVPVVAAEAAGGVRASSAASAARPGTRRPATKPALPPLNGGSRSNIPLPHEQQEKPAEASGAASGGGGEPPAGGGSGPAPAKARTFDRSKYSRSRTGVVGGPARPVSLDDGAGVLLGFIVYGWFVLPLVTGGPSAVKNVLRAKFFNKDAQGNWLP